MNFARFGFAAILLHLCGAFSSHTEAADERFPLFKLLTEENPPRILCYTPSQLDPRNPANQVNLKTSSIRADLEAIRPAFDGLVLYGYHEACTPRIMAIAKDLKFRCVILGIWDPKSADEVLGVGRMAKDFRQDYATAVIVGNEGITFNRYEAEDLQIAAGLLRKHIEGIVPMTTSEPLVGYKHDFIRDFGDFACPNIHPFFDRPNDDVAAAATWTRDEALKLAKQMNKPVILKETGFPHAGRPTDSVENQAAFWSAYTKPGLLAGEKDSPAWVYFGVGFEAFDLPWKAEASGLPVEKSWGLMSPDRKPYPAFDLWKKLGGK